MKRINFICVLFCIVSNVAFSQIRWDSLPGTKFQYPNAVNILYADSNYLYVSGGFTKVDETPMKCIAKWNGVKWDSMGAGINEYPGFFGTVNSMAHYHNKLYVAGIFPALGNVTAYSIGTWDGSKWDSMPIQPFKHDSGGIVSALTVINNKLYMAGLFDTVAGQPGVIGIANWNDTNWSSMNFPNIPIGNNGIMAVCQYNGSIYAAGSFGNDTVGSILRWDNTGWHSVDSGIKNAFITSMVVYKGELYVSGYFVQSDGNIGNNIQRWNGTKWRDVDGGSNDQIGGLLVYNNKLYALGEYTYIGGFYAPGIAEWDSLKWCRPDGANAFLNNGYHPITGCIYKDSLFVGGNFTQIDGEAIDNIAEWIGGNYIDSCSNEALGINEIEKNIEVINIYPNPSNGAFTLDFNTPVDGTIEVYDITGREVYKQTLKSENTEINLSGQPAGMYFYRAINNESSLIGEGKIVIQK